MPFSGSGSFAVYTPGNPAVTGTTISSTAFNNTMNDFATGLSNTITRDGQSPATANIPMGSHKLTGLSAGTVAGDSVRFEQLATIPELTSLTTINGATANGRLISQTIFTASGTWTKPTGCNSIVVEVQGAGGAGGNTTATAAGTYSACSGGAAGAYGLKRITTVAASYAVTIGAGGLTSGGVGANGGTGGTSSFGAEVSCTGGIGGRGAAAATTTYATSAAGGTSTGGDVNVSGQASSPAWTSAAATNGAGTSGAPSRFGGGGVSNLNAASGAGLGYGAGGGGSILGPSNAAAIGGAGAPGIVIVWEYA